MARIQGHEVSIGKVFGDDYAFTIPPYQRPYSWDTSNAEDLADDLIDAMRNSENGEVNPYFLGSIVLIKDDDSSASELVDGQQRITTISLLLRALQENLSGEDADHVKTMIYEKGNRIKGTQDRFRLTVRERDRDFFQDELIRTKQLSGIESIKRKLPDAQQNMLDNLIALNHKVSELSSEERADLATYLVQNTFLIVVWTPDLSSAFRIFSILNDRGMDLSAADILKAEIIGKIPEREIEIYTKLWEDTEEQLGKNEFTGLFSHIRMIHLKKKLKGTVLAEIREHVKPAQRATQFIKDELIPYANAYEEILHQRFESTTGAEDINRYFRYIKRVAETDWQAPAILFLSKHREEISKLKDFFQGLERLAMGMWLCRFNVNDRLKRYSNLLQQIENGTSPDALVLSQEEIKTCKSVLSGDIFNLSPKPKRSAILLRLDESFSSGEATYNLPTITIEHILPQTPPKDSKWLEWWPDAESRKLRTHQIGNLALLNRRQNSGAKNYAFDKKKSSYFLGKSGTSPFTLTTRVCQETEWTPVIWERHQDERVSKLLKIWSLE